MVALPTQEGTTLHAIERAVSGLLDGKQFFWWLVLSRTGRKSYGSIYLCRCVCGAQREIPRCNLVSGKTKSCGCQKSALIGEARKTHGLYRSPTYSSWSSMIQRCTNRKVKCYPNYGGRGIQVCERWRNSFETFLADMGGKPRKGMSIERIDVNGNYEPANCIWATPTLQARNTRRTKLTELDIAALRDPSTNKAAELRARGINKSTINAARRGQNWKEINGATS